MSNFCLVFCVQWHTDNLADLYMENQGNYGYHCHRVFTMPSEHNLKVKEHLLNSKKTLQTQIDVLCLYISCNDFFNVCNNSFLA